ncbi:hypothetical protein WT10_10435 [Burkholderia stagnalis]|nr:hypothetical protein WS59_20585 [Burkholderia stagnalis]KVN21770.1 hypothetical protein WT10_10435 [Burkholderia stagnalis]
MLVSEVSRIHYFEHPAVQKQESGHVAVFHESLADVVDLAAAIYAFRVGQECDGAAGPLRARCQVMEFARSITPDRMELCFDKNAWYFPDRPAVQLFSAVDCHVLWHDDQAFMRWFIGEWAVRNAYE